MNKITQKELLLLNKIVNMASGNPIPAISAQFAQLIRSYVNEELEQQRKRVTESFNQGWINDNQF